MVFKLKLFEVLSSVSPQAPNGFSWVRREDVGAIQISLYDEDILRYLKEYSRDGLEVKREMQDWYHLLIVHPQDERMLASELKNEFYLPRAFDQGLEICSEECSQIQKELSLNFELRFLRSECLGKEKGYDVRLKLF